MEWVKTKFRTAVTQKSSRGSLPFRFTGLRMIAAVFLVRMQVYHVFVLCSARLHDHGTVERSISSNTEECVRDWGYREQRAEEIVWTYE